MSSGSTYPRNTMAEQDMFHYPEFNTVATELHHTRCNDPSVDATFPYGSFMGRWFIHTRPYEGDNPLAPHTTTPSSQSSRVKLLLVN